MARQTIQRRAIQRVFEVEARPLRVEEIFALGRKQVESLNLATVYRGINQLLEQGWLQRIDSPAGSVAYEQANKDHHHHFQCRSCSRIFDIPGRCPFQHDEFLPEGFQAESHHIFIYGICAQCAIK